MEIVLTKEICIPGTRVVPSEYLRKRHPDYIIRKSDGIDYKTVATIKQLDHEDDIIVVLWDGMTDTHRLELRQLALYQPPTIYPDLIEALNILESKLE